MKELTSLPMTITGAAGICNEKQIESIIACPQRDRSPSVLPAAGRRSVMQPVTLV
jgi:hypothetical protein